MTSNHNKFNNLENQVMDKIKSGQVKIRSKYVFLARKLGLNGALSLTVIIAIVFFNLILFYMRSTENLYYLSFGRYGIWAFLESFPYLLTLAFIVLLLIASFLVSKTGWSYKRPFGYIVSGLILLVLILGGVSTYSNISNKIETQVFNKQFLGKVFRPFIHPCVEAHDKGTAGLIYDTDKHYLILKTPRGLEKLKCVHINCQQEFSPGEFVVATGERNDKEFVAKKIKTADPETSFSILKNEIDHKFCGGECAHHSKEILNFSPEANTCAQACVKHKTIPKQCIHKCVK